MCKRCLNAPLGKELRREDSETVEIRFGNVSPCWSCQKCKVMEKERNSHLVFFVLLLWPMSTLVANIRRNDSKDKVSGLWQIMNRGLKFGKFGTWGGKFS